MGGVRSLVLLSGLFWVARHFHLNLNGAYAADAIKIVSEMNLPHGATTLLSFTAMVIGLWAAFVSHLFAYYGRGANFLEGAPGTADYRTYVAAQDYRLLSNLLNKPTPPDKWRIGFTIYGAVVTFALAHLRRFGSFAPFNANFPTASFGFPARLRLQSPLSLLVSDFFRLGNQGAYFALRWDEVAPSISATVLGIGAGAFFDDWRYLGRDFVSYAPTQTYVPATNRF